MICTFNFTGPTSYVSFKCQSDQIVILLEDKTSTRIEIPNIRRWNKFNVISPTIRRFLTFKHK